MRKRAARIAVFALLVLLGFLGFAGNDHAASEQHIWLHYDYMVRPDGLSYAPQPESIQLVVDAFARHGIQLSIDPQHTVIPYKRGLGFSYRLPYSCPDDGPGSGITPDDTASFWRLKAQYFHPTAQHEWHYAIFGDVLDCGDYTGYSEIGGDNFALGWNSLVDGGGYPFPHDTLVRAEAGLFMHELGHNLGLRHGGNVDLPNYKPNYVSVMNYAYLYGIPTTKSPGSTAPGGWRIDYSDSALPTLDESNLDESAGIGGRPTDVSLVLRTQCVEGPLLRVPGYGPIDWNQNGTIEVGVRRDLTGDCYLSTLRGYDDWAEVHAWLAASKHPPPTLEPEAALPLVSDVSPAEGARVGGNVVVIHGSHFRKVTHVYFSNEYLAPLGSSVEVSFTIKSDNEIDVVAPPHGYGKVDVLLETDSTTSSPMDTDVYTYVVPHIDTVTPSSAELGDLPMSVTLSGSHLDLVRQLQSASDGTGLQIRDWHLVDPHTIVAAVQLGYNNGYATFSDSFVWDDGYYAADSGVSPSTAVFTVFSPWRPVITSLDPSHGPAGTVVTVHGSNFIVTPPYEPTYSPDVALFWDSLIGPVFQPVAGNVIDDHTLTLTIPELPAPFQTPIGPVRIILDSALGRSDATPADEFTYESP